MTPNTYRRAYAGGTFDLFHAGHVALFRRIREELADELVVALNTDDFAARYKGRRPIMTLDERLAVVAACRYVDVAIVNVGDGDSRPAIEAAGGVDVIVHGDDWVGPDLVHRQMGLPPTWLAERGIHVHYLPYTAGVSASEIVHRVRTAADSERRTQAFAIDNSGVGRRR